MSLEIKGTFAVGFALLTSVTTCNPTDSLSFSRIAILATRGAWDGLKLDEIV